MTKKSGLAFAGSEFAKANGQHSIGQKKVSFPANTSLQFLDGKRFGSKVGVNAGNKK